MKITLKAVIILIITFIANHTSAQIGINSITVPTQYLTSDNKIIISPTTATTNVPFKINLSTWLDNSGNPNINQISLVLYTFNGSIKVALSNPVIITQTFFKKNQSMKDTTINFSITKSLLNNGTIDILFTVPTSTQPQGLNNTAHSYWVGVVTAPPVGTGAIPVPDPPAGTPPGVVPVFSFGLDAGGSHDLSRGNYARAGWHNEGVSFFAYDHLVPGTVPIYRYTGVYPGNRVATLFTSNPDAGDGGFWQKIGVSFYAFDNQAAVTVPVYCFTNAQDYDQYFCYWYQPPGYWIRKQLSFYAYPIVGKDPM